MPDHARPTLIRLGAVVIALVLFVLAVDGEVSRTEALDRWVGTATISAEGITVPLGFTVLVDPGRGAAWEWRYQGFVLGSGALAAYVSGSRVDGQLFLTGGLAFDPSQAFLPCNFSGTILGNRVEGVFDPGSCGGTGTFVLVKQ